MSFGLSGGNLFISDSSLVTSVTGNWCALQVLTDYPDFDLTIDGQELSVGDIFNGSLDYKGVIIYGNITSFTAISGYFRLYGGTNLGV